MTSQFLTTVQISYDLLLGLMSPNVHATNKWQMSSLFGFSPIPVTSIQNSPGTDPIHIYSSCNAPSPIPIPHINIQKLASVSTVIFESPPESYQNQLISAKMSRASDKYSLFKLSGLPTLQIKVSELTTTSTSTCTPFILDYLQSTVQWLNQLSAEYSFRTNYNSMSDIHV